MCYPPLGAYRKMSTTPPVLARKEATWRFRGLVSDIMLAQFLEYITEGQDMAVTRIPIPAWAKTQQADERLELSLAELDLAVRTVNGLEEEGIFTVGDLLNCTPERLLEIPNLGEKTLTTIYTALKENDFHRATYPSECAEEEPSYPLLRRMAPEGRE